MGDGELGPQEDDIQERSLSFNLGANWFAGANTTVEARGYVSTYAEDATGRLAPPRSTPLEPGALDQRFVKTDVSVAHAIGSRQMLQGGVEWSRDRYQGTNRVRDEATGHEADTAVEHWKARGVDLSHILAFPEIEEGAPRKVRMANLAIVGTHSTNGVAAIHSELLRTVTVPGHAGRSVLAR